MSQWESVSESDGFALAPLSVAVPSPSSEKRRRPGSSESEIGKSAKRRRPKKASKEQKSPAGGMALWGGLIGVASLSILAVAAMLVLTLRGGKTANNVADGQVDVAQAIENAETNKRARIEAGDSFLAVVDAPVPPLENDRPRAKRTASKSVPTDKRKTEEQTVPTAEPDPQSQAADIPLQLASNVSSSTHCFASMKGPFCLSYQPVERVLAFDIRVKSRGQAAPEDNIATNAAAAAERGANEPGDGPTISLQVLDDTASEAGGDNARVQLVREGSFDKGVLVRYTVSGSATAFEDYTGLPNYSPSAREGKISFPSKNKTSNLVILATKDEIAEQPETVIITLMPGEGYTLGPGSEATIVIHDDTSSPTAKSNSSNKPWGQPKQNVGPARKFTGPNGEVVEFQPKQVFASQIVTDLRSGRAVGEFHYLAPVWRDGVLSPDADFVVGPDSYPRYVTDPGPNSAHHNGMDRTEREGLLFIWEQKKDEPVQRIQLEYAVGWFDFISATEIAVLTYTPNPELQVWDVTTAELRSQIPLDAESFPLWEMRSQNDPRQFVFENWPWRGTVSFGGRYVAMGGGLGIELIDLNENKVAGRIPIADAPAHQPFQKEWTQKEISLGTKEDTYYSKYRGLCFTTDGRELLALVNSRLYGWDVSEGRGLFRANVPSHLAGPPLRGPRPNTAILPYSVGRRHGRNEREPGAVVNTRTGAAVEYFGFTPVRWIDETHLLGAGKEFFAPHSPLSAQDRDTLEERVRRRLRSVRDFGPEMRDAVQHQKDYLFTTVFDVSNDSLNEFPDLMTDEEEIGLDPAIAAIGPRPQATLGDFSDVDIQTPQPPAQWSVPVPPEVERTGVSVKSLPNGLFAQGTSRATVASVLEYQPKDGFDLKNGKVVLRQFDLPNGNAIGAPIELWPWVFTKKRKEPATSAYTVAATPDGSLFAMQDPANAERLDVWSADGERLLGLIPSVTKAPIQWLYWARDDTLLVLVRGVLSGWSVTDGKLKFAVDGGYQPPLRVAPDGSWVAALSNAQTHVDVFDAASGKCLGRWQAEEERAWWWLLMAPDGSKLVALRAGMPFTGRMSGMKRAAADILDVASGALDRSAEFYELTSRAKLENGVWADPGRIVVKINAIVFGVDLEYTMATTRMLMDGNFGPLENDFRELAGTLWQKVGTPVRGEPQSVYWQPVRLPDPFRQQILNDDAIRPFGPGSPVKVEFDLTKEPYSKAAALRFAALLQQRGHVIGPDGWTMRAVADVRNSELFLITPGGRINVPQVQVKWELFDPNGKSAWKTTEVANFAYTASRYTTNSKTSLLGGNFATEAHLDFGSKDPREAMTDEILEYFGKTRRLPDPFPYALMPAGDKEAKLPFEARFEPLHH